MTLLERIEYFTRASVNQDDDREDSELINSLSLYDLLTEISSALENAGIDFNTNF